MKKLLADLVVLSVIGILGFAAISEARACYKFIPFHQEGHQQSH